MSKESELVKRTILTFNNKGEECEVVYDGHLDLIGGEKISVGGNSQIFGGRISRGNYLIMNPDIAYRISIKDGDASSVDRRYYLTKIPN